MKISNEVLTCLGALTFLILLVLADGLIVWGLGNLIIWTFKINFTLYYWQSIILGIVVSVITYPMRKKNK